MSKYLVSYLLHDVKWEGTDLLQSMDGNLILKTSVSPLLEQIIVHLSSTEQHL